mmetsp:Transcript_16575/g.43016  ORF Transcript_16575/g.43016 Transcript_16575/m.43016 type:complete len:675 (-) Transcript_16575:99-2123(-)
MSILRDCPNQPNNQTKHMIGDLTMSHAALVRSGAADIASRVNGEAAAAGEAVAVGLDPEASDVDTSTHSSSAAEDIVVDECVGAPPADPSGVASGDFNGATDSLAEHCNDPSVAVQPAEGAGAGDGDALLNTVGKVAITAAPTSPEVAMPVVAGAPPPVDGAGEALESVEAMQVCELPVFNQHVGRIIGKRGQTITDIQQRSGARVEIPQQCDRGTAMRRIRIYGTAEQIEYCSVLVRLQLPNQTETEIARLQQEVADLQARHSASLALRVIEVPMDHVGRIIGRHGQYLRQLKETTGATVTLPRFSLHGSPHTHQVFTIMGNVAEVAACESVLQEKIQECLSTSPPHGGGGGHHGGRRSKDHGGAEGGPTNHLSRKVLFVEVPNEHVGRVIGKGGAAIRELQRQTGAKVHLPGESAAPYREMQIHGSDEQRQMCYDLLIEKVPYLEQAVHRVVVTPVAHRGPGGGGPSPNARHGHGHPHGVHMRPHGHGLGSPNMHPYTPPSAPMHYHPYNAIAYDSEMAYPQGMQMYPSGMIFQPGMPMQPGMPTHVFTDPVAYHMTPQLHAYDDPSMSPPGYDWSGAPPAGVAAMAPMYPHPGMEMMIMQQQAAAAGMAQATSPTMEQAPSHSVPGRASLDPNSVELASAQSMQDGAWGKPGPIAEGQDKWPEPQPGHESM